MDGPKAEEENQVWLSRLHAYDGVPFLSLIYIHSLRSVFFKIIEIATTNKKIPVPRAGIFYFTLVTLSMVAI